MTGCRKKINKEKVFQNKRVLVTRRELSVGGHLITGYLVEEVPGDAVAVELGEVASAALSKEEYMKEAERLWNEKRVCELEQLQIFLVWCLHW